MLFSKKPQVDAPFGSRWTRKVPGVDHQEAPNSEQCTVVNQEGAEKSMSGAEM